MSGKARCCPGCRLRRRAQQTAMVLVGLLLCLKSGAQMPALPGPIVPIHIGDHDQQKPEAAYDSVNKRFLVVWQDWWNDGSNVEYDVRAQMVDRDGTVLGDTITVSAISGDQEVYLYDPVAFDPVSKRFLVVWSNNGNEYCTWAVHGQLVDSDGTLYGGPFLISPCSEGNPHRAVAPRVKADTVNGGFLVAWTGPWESAPFDVYCQLVNADGSLRGSTIQLTDYPDCYGAGNVHVAFDSNHARFLVAWALWCDASHLRARLVNADGTPYGQEIPICTGDLYFADYLCFDPSNSRYLITWGWSGQTRPGQFLTADGELDGPPITIPLRSWAVPDGAYDPACRRYVAIGDASEEQMCLNASYLNSDGTACGPVFRAFGVWDLPGREWFPGSLEARVCAGDPDFGCLALWADCPHYQATGSDVYSRLIKYGPPPNYAKKDKDGAWGVVGNAVVTAAFEDYFYAERETRECGIRVEKPCHGLGAGAKVDLRGTVRTSEHGERYVEAEAVFQHGWGNVEPLGLTKKALGGGDWLYQSGSPWPITLCGQKGVKDGFGLNNIGLLVRVWGKVTDHEQVPEPTWLKVSDGSGVEVKCIVPTVVTFDPAWQYVSVTGISSCEKVGDDLQRVVLIKPESTIEHY